MPNRLMTTISVTTLYLAVQLAAIYLVARIWVLG